MAEMEEIPKKSKKKRRILRKIKVKVRYCFDLRPKVKWVGVTFGGWSEDTLPEEQIKVMFKEVFVWLVELILMGALINIPVTIFTNVSFNAVNALGLGLFAWLVRHTYQGWVVGKVRTNKALPKMEVKVDNHDRS